MRAGLLADGLSTISCRRTSMADRGKVLLLVKTVHSQRMASTTRTRTNLFLTFDAFETLFHPRLPIHEQYASAAHAFGLSPAIVTPEKLKETFKNAFKTQAKKRPNYGREYVLRGQYGGPRQWWDEVIRASFSQVMMNSHSNQRNNDTNTNDYDKNGTIERHNEDASFTLPDGLSENLMYRFASSEGYTLYDDAMPFFETMRNLRSAKSKNANNTNNNDHHRTGLGIFDRVFLGVISNSDDRVPVALKSLGLSVGDVRADQQRSSMELPGFEEIHQRQNHRNGNEVANQTCNDEHAECTVNNDIDLIITSYEAGESKPNRAIFDVAKRQAHRLLLTAREQECSSMAADKENSDSSITTTSAVHCPSPDSEEEKWVYVHVGDDYEKDYKAAIDAGWDSYLLPRGDDTAGLPAGVKVVHSLTDLIEELEKKYS